MGNVKLHTRHRARMRAFQVLYSLLFTPVDSIETLQERFVDMPDATDADMDAETPPHPTQAQGYAWTLSAGVWANTKALDANIEEFLKNWRMERLGKIELTVLRLAMYEIMHQSDVPSKVIINEALELTRTFGDGKSTTFINGLLDAAIKKREPAPTTKA